ncbi:MAG: PAS domain S-box protein [Candidatus Binatia bacterium]|nr:PAS domain S-box protein [Candidatus Binatia bacterium]
MLWERRSNGVVGVNDTRKTKAELIAELQALRHEVAALRAAAAEQRQTVPLGFPAPLAHAADEIVSVLDRQGTIRDVSANVASVLGYRAPGIIGVNFFAALHPDDFTRVQQVFTELLATTGAHASLELRRLRADGRWQRMAVHMTNLLDDPRVQGIVVRSTPLREEHLQVHQLGRQLHESEKKYRRLYDSITDGIVRTTADHLIVECNQTFATLLGYTPAELRGKHCHELTPARWHAYEEEMLTSQLLVRGYTDEYEKEFVSRDGSLVPVSVKVWTVTDEHGTVEAIWGIVRDLRSRKRIEDALHRSRQQYQALVDSIDGIVWEADAATLQFTFVSPQAERLLGYPQAQWVEEQDFWSKHLHPEDRAWAVNFCLAQIQEKRTHRFEYRMLAADGRVVWIRDVVSVIVENEQPVKLRGVMIDVTAQKQAELLVEAERDFARQIMETMGQGLAVLDPDGRVVYLNPALSRLAGYQPEGVMGQPALRFVPSERQPLVMQRFKRLRQGEAMTYETTIRRADGQEVPVLCTGVPLRNGERISGSIWVLTDLTDWKRAEAERQHLQRQLFQAQKLESVGVLAGGVAHDFNNLLLIMMGNMELALDDLPAGTRGRGRIQEALEAGRRAAYLVQQLLAFSRPQDGVRQVVRLHAVIRDTLHLLRVTLPETVQVRCVVPSAGGTCHLSLAEMCDEPAVCCPVETRADAVWGDPAQLQQVLMNLCLNALDAMADTGGVLEICLERVVLDHRSVPALAHLRPGPYVRLAVRDTGCGMSAEIKERVFDPFFTTKPVGKGNGLGLAVVYGIVRAHDGGITVESQPGAGTTMSVYLPAGAEDVGAPKEG